MNQELFGNADAIVEIYRTICSHELLKGNITSCGCKKVKSKSEQKIREILNKKALNIKLSFILLL